MTFRVRWSRSPSTLFPHFRRLAELAVRRLLAQLDATVNRVVEVRENATGKRARGAGVTYREATLAERRHRTLDFLRLEAPVIQPKGRLLVRLLLHLEERISADLKVCRSSIRVPHDLTESQLFLVEL